MESNIAQYQIDELIFESDNTLVYRGHHQSDGNRAVLKLLKQEYPAPSDLVRYQQEFRLTQELDAPGVIRVLGLEKYKNSLVILLEDFDGVSLRLLYPQQALPIEHFLKLAIKITSSLGQVHDANVIHKDINPSNIILNQETGELKLIDFGASTRLLRENIKAQNPQGLEGTLAYISPEQTGRMNRYLDYRSDFYSLGVTFYELLTGKLPFEGNDALEIIHQHIAKIPELPAPELNIPDVVSELILKLLAKAAENRYQTAQSITADLEKCLESWRRHGYIDSFELGQKATLGSFHISQKLYGREVEIDRLVDAYESAASGDKRMMLVTGYSGIGKSSLVHEVHRFVTQKRGTYISGKFDQLLRNTPYSAIANAFQEMVRQLLTESESELHFWKQKLLQSLGQSGQLIIDLIPELELIIGEQPALPEMGPNEAQINFIQATQRFIRVFCQAEHPLIIFLDDLQWADLASLNLIRLIMQEESIGHLFLIGAYRDNEVDATHSLMITLEDLRAANIVVDQVTLSPLTQKQLTQMVADTLSQEADAVEPLAELIMLKTQGNPFFVNQFLSTLSQEGIFTFDAEQLCWTWDLNQIEAIGITDQVADLLGRNIKRLPEETQSVIRLAACIGNQFDLKTLAIIRECSVAETFTQLSPAIFQGLIVPLSTFEITDDRELDSPLVIHHFKFLHDRVQQAAYALFDADHRKPVHLKIGRLLLANMPDEEREERLFELVDHLNQGQELIKPDERIQLVSLNLEAGRKAKDAIAFVSAQDYLKIALDNITGDIWADHYKLAFELHLELIEVAYLNSNLDSAKSLVDQTLKHARSALEQARLYHFLVLIYTLQANYDQAIEALGAALRILNVDMPVDGNFRQALSLEMDKIDNYFRVRSIASAIDEPEMVDPEQRMVVTLINSAMASMFLKGRLDLFSAMVAIGVNTSLKYGYTTRAPYIFTGYGIILVAQFGQYQKAYEFSQLALEIAEKLNDLASVCQVCDVHIAHIHHWSQPLATSIHVSNLGYQAGVHSGGAQWASYLLMYKSFNQIARGKTLEKLLNQDIDEGLQFARKMKNTMAGDVILGAKLAVVNLLGTTENRFSFDIPEISESHFLQRCKDNKSMLGLGLYTIFKAQILYLYGNPEEALKLCEEGGSLLAIPTVFAASEQNFYRSLILIALYADADKTRQGDHWQQLLANQAQMKIWADSCEENFSHKYFLVAAEMARLEGQKLDAIKLYQQAIGAAKVNDFVQNEALANELAGLFWRAEGQPQYAAMHLTEAHYGYQLWGAARKAADLVERYPELLSTRHAPSFAASSNLESSTSSLTIAERPEALDLVTILKSSQAISGETELEDLLMTLIDNAIENAGAQRGCLIMEKEGQWVIEADGTTGPEPRVVQQSIPVNASSDDVDNVPRVSSSIVNYVIRTGENLLIGDAILDDRFASDEYILQQRTHSVLCMPLVNQGVVSGILYLENNLSSGAFNSDRLALLKLLSSQMAISLDKARLYEDSLKQQDNLARLVEELEAKNMELERFVYTVSHELKSPLVTISGFAGMLGKDVFENSTVRVEHDIRQINSAVGTMSVLLENLLELSRVGRAINPSESVSLTELANSVVDIVSLQAAELDLEIVISPDLPVVFGDRIRLHEVFQNLIENAIKFRGDHPQPRIEIGSRETEGGVVCYVRDNGTGIDPTYHQKVFGLFERLNNQIDGTGIGLALVHRILELHGGKIWVESQGAGQGSTFFFSIPKQPVLAE